MANKTIIHKKKRSNRFKMPQISLTPLIDTSLTLLIIFMITAPIVQNGIKVDLPQGNSKEVGKQQELVVSMRKDGNLFFNSYPIEKNELVKSIQKALVQREDIPVYIRADESISYGKVIEIVDKLKMAGVKYIAMSTRAIL
ncbi:biopolymer transporter ExbD [Candidatus Babeliales bacterium]|nr:biopolymer transporter ExbD [Candidatus Babeliales bacterium]